MDTWILVLWRIPIFLITILYTIEYFGSSQELLELLRLLYIYYNDFYRYIYINTVYLALKIVGQTFFLRESLSFIVIKTAANISTLLCIKSFYLYLHCGYTACYIYYYIVFITTNGYFWPRMEIFHSNSTVLSIEARDIKHIPMYSNKMQQKRFSHGTTIVTYYYT